MFGTSFKLCLVALELLTVANAVTIGPVGDLNIVNLDIGPDGYPRPSVLAGGTFPGPVIAGKKGDRFTINVTNSLTDPRMLRSTSIHWHGIFQNGTNWADGPAMVTQCPILPNNSFVYDFNVYDQAVAILAPEFYTDFFGQWVATQYCDGLRGPFIVYDPDDPYLDEYDVDDGESSDFISMILTGKFFRIHVASPTPFGSSHSLTTLINGLGRTIQHEVTLNTLSPLAVISVEATKRYRFRLIGLSCDAPFNFTIHDHSMTIIETDGQNTTPLVVDSLFIYAGQRYSVIVHANQPVNNYWIRADPLATRGTAGFDNGRNSGILRYIGAKEVDPITNGISTRPLNEDDLQSLEKPQPPGKPELNGADIVVPIVQTWHEDRQVFDINGVTYESPSVPVLLQILNGTYSASDLMPNGSVYKLKPNSSVELQIHGVDRGGPHTFWVIKNALSNEYNWDNPTRRDTVPTGFSGNVTVIRFFTDNAGPWFLHCHIDWHIELGLAIIFAEDPEGTEAHVKPIPPSFDQLCPAYNKFNPDVAILNITATHPVNFK
ncbi:hypothetical protein DXG01_000330 [Tephrocybe rancida]|nr:hypothetical protein DXG01_000330 [Tephrocybe rancida]